VVENHQCSCGPLGPWKPCGSHRPDAGLAMAAGLAPPIQLRQTEVQSAARRLLLARDLTSRSELAQIVGVHSQVLRGLACREPSVALRLGESQLDTLGDTLSQAVEQSSENRV